MSAAATPAPATAAEELAKQVLNAFAGLEQRLVNVMAEIPEDRQDYWREKFRTELHGFEQIIGVGK